MENISQGTQFNHPYAGLPREHFWRTGVAQSTPFFLNGIYSKKFEMSQSDKIATAGSCFADHVSRYLKTFGYNVIDVEPAPDCLPSALHTKNGYGIYSARYGNIYTAAQLLQLGREAITLKPQPEITWLKDGKYLDAIRPSVIPDGFHSEEQVLDERRKHLTAVKKLFLEMDIFVFTFGLTEAWAHKKNNTIYPSAPGVIAGSWIPEKYIFKNFSSDEIVSAFTEFTRIVTEARSGKTFRTILTVSPVPITATWSGEHVLTANTYSKATLLTAARQLSRDSGIIDYFPSFEIINNPRLHSIAFKENLRSVREEAVSIVMEHFFEQHNLMSIHERNGDYVTPATELGRVSSQDPQCEDALLDAFSASMEKSLHEGKVIDKNYTQIIGNSHLASFKLAVEGMMSRDTLDTIDFIPINWVAGERNVNKRDFLDQITSNDLDDKYKNLIRIANKSKRSSLVFVGMGLWGDGIIRCFGPLEAITFGPDGTADLDRQASPHIDHASSLDDVSSSIIDVFEEKLTEFEKTIDKILTNQVVKMFKWYCAPLPTEACARYRFGDEYVDSRSQAIYNDIYIKLMKKKLGHYIERGVIILQDLETINSTGFTDDIYRYNEPVYGIHCNAEYFARHIKLGKV